MLKLANTPHYIQLTRLNKPIGIYLLLWPCLWALILAAQGWPSLFLTCVFVLGVVLMRSAGCVINDFADRNFDSKVLRTKLRPLATGAISTAEAKSLFVILVLCSFALVLLLNWQTIVLSFIALILASMYPFMKRYTHFPQVVLGAAFGWSIPMAFMATIEFLPWWIWLLYLANLAWTVAYDTQYAMVDREYDLKIGIKSTAIFFGKYDVLAIVILQVTSLVLILAVLWLNQSHFIAYFGLLASSLLFVHQFRLCRTYDVNKCLQAFLNNHWVGALLTVSILVGLVL